VTHVCKCKLLPVKLLQELGDKGMKETGRGDQFMYEIFDTL
jgi:hypothetical protein